MLASTNHGIQPPSGSGAAGTERPSSSLPVWLRHFRDIQDLTHRAAGLLINSDSQVVFRLENPLCSRSPELVTGVACAERLLRVLPSESSEPSSASVVVLLRDLERLVEAIAPQAESPESDPLLEATLYDLRATLLEFSRERPQLLEEQERTRQSALAEYLQHRGPLCVPLDYANRWQVGVRLAEEVLEPTIPADEWRSLLDAVTELMNVQEYSRQLSGNEDPDTDWHYLHEFANGGSMVKASAELESWLQASSKQTQVIGAQKAIDELLSALRPLDPPLEPPELYKNALQSVHACITKFRELISREESEALARLQEWCGGPISIREYGQTILERLQVNDPFFIDQLLAPIDRHLLSLLELSAGFIRCEQGSLKSTVVDDDARKHARVILLWCDVLAEATVGAPSWEKVRSRLALLSEDILPQHERAAYRSGRELLDRLRDAA